MFYSVLYSLSSPPCQSLTTLLIFISASHHSPVISLGFQENGKKQIYKKSWSSILGDDFEHTINTLPRPAPQKKVLEGKMTWKLSDLIIWCWGWLGSLLNEITFFRAIGFPPSFIISTISICCFVGLLCFASWLKTLILYQCVIYLREDLGYRVMGERSGPSF